MPSPRTKWEFLRRRVIWILLILLVPSFVLFFHATTRSQARGPGGAAGILFGKPVSWETFDEQQRWLRRRLEEHVRDLSPELISILLTQQTWERLMVLGEAKRTRLRVHDEELVAFIREIPAFQQDGEFVPERYRLFLRAAGTTPQTFERLLRDDLLVDKLATSVKRQAAVTEAQVKEAYVAAHERLRASVIVFNTESYAEEVARTLTDDDIRASYDAHTEVFRVPEQVAFEQAGRSREELAAQLSLSEDELSAFHQARQDDFARSDGTTPPLEEVREEVRARLADERAGRQLTTLSLDLQDDRDANLRFEEMVAVRSLTLQAVGPVSAGNMWVPGGPEPAVLQAVSSVAAGQLSEVIKTDHGVYVARVTQRIPSRIPPLDEVRIQTKERLVQERAKQAAKDAAQTLHATLKARQAAGWRFEESLLALDVTPQTPPAFTRTDPLDPIGYEPAVNEAAFATSLGSLSDVIERSVGFVLLRPEERLEPDKSRLAEEAPALRERLLKEAESARLQEWLGDVRARAKFQSFVESVPSSP